MNLSPPALERLREMAKTGGYSAREIEPELMRKGYVEIVSRTVWGSSWRMTEAGRAALAAAEPTAPTSPAKAEEAGER